MNSKNSEFQKEKKFNFKNSIEYSENAIVSKHVIRDSCGNISLFAFDAKEELSEHTAPFDALVQVLEGKAEIKIRSEKHTLTGGESIVMPANIPHALFAVEKFKMLLTMIKSK
jgi:quercetin dioxygenase-like cupin family protein